MSYYPACNADRPPNFPIAYDPREWDMDGGPIKAGYSSWINPISTWLGYSFQEFGLQNLTSFVGGVLLGWSWLPLTLDPVTQTRSSSEAFLRTALETDSNLVIYKSALAKRVVFQGLTARSVAVNDGDCFYSINATKEVIISAGVVGILYREGMRDLTLKVWS